MIHTLAVSCYRSLHELIVPLTKLNVITGPNGSGKSNFYRALTLLAQTASGGAVQALAREGGLPSTFWAGPDAATVAKSSGGATIWATNKSAPKRLKLGFSGDTFGYAVSFGLPIPDNSRFHLDPMIKSEHIWAGGAYRQATALVARAGPLVQVRRQRAWEALNLGLSDFESVFSAVADPVATPEIFVLREAIQGWRFYDHLRTDADAPARTPQIGTLTTVLHPSGRDLAAALQTIFEIGDSAAMHNAVSDAFPGAHISIGAQEDGRFVLHFHQEGLLRPLQAAELSDGTLRYLLLIAALLTPRPPPLLVLNEPETSLHPDLLPALARLIISASTKTQTWVISHAQGLIQALTALPTCNLIELAKSFSQTKVVGQGQLDRPSWYWPDG